MNPSTITHPIQINLRLGVSIGIGWLLVESKGLEAVGQLLGFDRRNYMDEVCSICCVKAGNSFVNDPNPNSFNDSPNFFNHPPQPQMYSCELCGNDAHYGYDCPPQVPLVYEPEPGYNQNFDDNFPQTSPKKQEEKNVAEEQAAKVSSQYWKHPIFYDDDDEESSIPLRDLISELPLSVAITPDLPITDSLIMEDEHLNTIPKTESDEENESSVEDLNLTPSESEDLFEDLSEDLSDIESECDMPFCDDFTTFSNPLFDSNNDFTSSDDESLSDEEVPEENFKIYSNPLFDEEIISTKIDPHHFNAESDLIESLLNRDTSIVSSPMFDSLLEEFSDWLLKGTYKKKGLSMMKSLPVARIEAIRLFLAYASFKDFVVYQMDVKSAFLYGKIEEEVYFQMSSMGELAFFLGLQVKQKEDGIFISQDKYLTKILKRFCFTDVKTANIPMETQKHFLKDEDGEEVDDHLYRSMIGSLMYLTSSRPDIMFAVCQPKLGLWYPKDSPFDLVAYIDSDYAGASLDRKSTTGGCQFLGCRLISCQCKKQTVVANSTTEAEYVAASSCCGQISISDCQYWNAQSLKY
ncbi:uncharacterized mitochondrial protein-like protein [Tanacetum coccineum]|uniref:Uncharacterized mitochondrial protein-like protein n=1 Tax=Tanacetum coccineum TaxID=301880 RepID=A0ABQ4WSN0_9ASTR